MKTLTFSLWCVGCAAASANDLAFSDPANVRPAPEWAVGQAQRGAAFDVLPGFKQPPRGFGIVPFFWWLGDPLTTSRLAWELEQMKDMGVSGYQINYAHTDQGGRSYGYTFPSDPPLFSEPWWDLVGWFVGEAKKQGAGVSLSDYTLGIGQGWRVDAVLREHPEVAGMQLRMEPDGRVVPETIPWSINPLHPRSGEWYANYFFGQFEQRFPGEGGTGLNFFFSDELGFGVGGWLWSAQFGEEFKKRKGYDVVPELAALFKDIGPRTPKVRMDYSDVMVALSEEGFFKPVFDWHQQRGMTLGCDHGGRGRDVTEFGDYFRTQRWNQGPGADQPHLGKDVIKAKVASSIAHLYQRPRVWLEGFYGSGWGTTSAGVADATFANFVMGYNLLSFHGMYYATHGGWWEWAPPDNTFRMPYWKHLRGFMDCAQRLSYLFTQGTHRCDVAILYPVAPMEAGMDGRQAVETAFRTGEVLYRQGVDFDFMDFESLDRAQVRDKALHVSGEVYRVVMLPAMKAIRHSTLKKAREFQRSGGIVLALGALPEASDRIGRNDPEVAAMVAELFPNGPVDNVMKHLPSRDYEGPGRIQHRRIGARDIYAIYGAPKDAIASFRATGQVDAWDPWTGESRALRVLSQTNGMTRLRLPLSETELQLVVFSPGNPQFDSGPPLDQPRIVAIDGDWEFELQPTADNRFGDFHWPPTPDLIGAEVRQLWYCEGDNTNGPWRKVSCSFGPRFLQSTNLPTGPDTKQYEFSWRWGIEGDPGHQGYHGLKEEVHDEFLAIGAIKSNGQSSPNVFGYTAGGPGYCFSTAVVSPRDQAGYLIAGELKPVQIWLNGEAVTNSTVQLRAGSNSLALKYDRPGRAYFVVSAQPEPPTGTEKAAPDGKPRFRSHPLASRWYNNPSILPFDVRTSEPKPIGWYRFTAPPGLRAMKLHARGKVQAWVDGHPMIPGEEGVFSTSTPPSRTNLVYLRIEQERGCYGGAAIPDPIELKCDAGSIALGDWSAIDGLLSYSGGAWYRKTVDIPSASRVVLNLGNLVSSAEVRVNGQAAGVRIAPPWTLDITPFVQPGENRIEVLVCNTLANHYTSVPTQYRGSTLAGLLGPVTLQLNSPGQLHLESLRNPVWKSADNLRDPSVLKTEAGYQLFYSRLAGNSGGWNNPSNWTVASVFTRDFVKFENQRDISPPGCASPGDAVRWHGRWLLPYQTYPSKPTQLVFAESPDLRTWTAPKPFLSEALNLPWNELHRVIDPSFVVDGNTLHCYFVGSASRTNSEGRRSHGNLMGHAITRDPNLTKWEILTSEQPLIGFSERAPDGVENTIVFRTGDCWTMIYSEGLQDQHLARATSLDLVSWKLAGPISLPRQPWMARKFGAPFVWREPSCWMMILMGTDTRDRTTFGLLTSEDACNWKLLPAVTPGDR